MIRTDALVIGGGLTALRCAEILSEKYNTLVISDGSGASPYIHGICIPLSDEDSVECFVEDTLKSGRYQADETLVRTLCEGAQALTQDFDFDRRDDGSYDLLRPLGSSVARVASVREHTGAFVMGKIRSQKRFEEKKLRALRLLVKEGRVCGALCYDRETDSFVTISARCVCLATGGFGGIFPFSTNTSDIGGDGIAMAYLAGASLRDMEFIQYEPTAALSPESLLGKSVITTMLYEGATFRNGRGEPFLHVERVDKDILSKAIYREILHGQTTENGGVYYDATAVPREVLMHKYKSYYERYRNAGVDITSEMMEVAPAPHTTLGGVVIDTKCHTTIRRLFAMGEVTGGLHGANRLGGNAGLETLVFGKIAGESAVAFLDADNTPMPELTDVACKNQPCDCAQIHTRVRIIAKNALGVIRNGENLSHAREELLSLIETISPYLAEKGYYSFDAMRAYNDALTILLAIESALRRKSSLGAHERDDAIDEEERYTIYLAKEKGLTKERLYE